MKKFDKVYMLKLRGHFAEKCKAVFCVCRDTKEGFLISVALILVGGLFFVGYVKADTASTTVTVGNSTPTLTVTLDRTTITLSENTSVWASTTLTITDGNGCGTISAVEASLVFASSTVDQSANLCGHSGANYSYDANLCYNATGCFATTTGTTCSTTVVDYDCGFEIWYPAQPSDASAPIPELPLAQWFVVGSTTDNVASASATNTTQTVEVATLNALNVTGTIAYPETAANANTGATNQTVTITDTGNTANDTEISGDVMCTSYGPPCTGNSFLPSQQKFDLIDQTYASLTYTLAATATPATIETVLATTTSTSTAITDDTYWGIAIPSGQTNGAYTGQNTFSAVAD